MGREYMHTQFWWNNLRESDHLDDPSVNGKIILKGIFKTWDWVGMDWIELAQNRGKCGGGGRSCECGIGNFSFHKMRGIS
jgi:hypothetical protein